MYIIALSKRFTSPIMGWPFPTHTEVERSTPGKVGCVYAWTKLQMQEQQAKAVLDYASRKTQYTRVELFGLDEKIIGRDAWDMTAAKGFYTPSPGLPTKEEIPIITVEYINNWLKEQKYLGREEVELAYQLGLAKIQKVIVKGHNLLKITFNDQSYLIKDPEHLDESTGIALQFLWKRYSGKAKKGGNLWLKEEMEAPIDGETATRNFSDNEKPKRVIRTKFPGVIVIEVFHHYGRYLWFSTDPKFDASGSGWTNMDSYITSTGEYLRKGYYRDNLPGDQYPEGWEFALKLYKRLEKIKGLNFKVSSPQFGSYTGLSIDFYLKPEWLDQKVQAKFGLIRGNILEKNWNEELPDKIAEFIEKQGITCIECGQEIEEVLINLNVRYCMECTFAKFDLEIPEFATGSFRYDDPELENWTFAINQGATSSYHLYRGDPDACRLLACIKQNPYDIQELCKIDFCGHGGDNIKKRKKVSQEMDSKLIFFQPEETLEQTSIFHIYFTPNKYYTGNIWVIARLDDIK